MCTLASLSNRSLPAGMRKLLPEKPVRLSPPLPPPAMRVQGMEFLGEEENSSL